MQACKRFATLAYGRERNAPVGGKPYKVRGLVARLNKTIQEDEQFS